MLREERDADAGLRVDAMAVDVERLLERVADLPSEGLGRLDVRLVGREDRELVTAHACHGVGVAHRALESCGHRLEHGVTGLAPETVVDRAELVEVDQQHAVRRLRPVRGHDGPVHAVGEEGAVGKPGELVVEGPLLQGLEVCLAAGDVPQAADRNRAVADLHRAQADLHREVRVVLAAAHRLGRLLGALRPGEQAPPVPRGFGDGVVMAGRDDVLQRPTDDLVGLVAEQPAGREVERLDQALLVGGHDPVRHVVHQRARAHLAVVQRRVEGRDLLERALQLSRLREQVDEGRDPGPHDLAEDRHEDEVDGAARVCGGRLGLVAPEGRDEDDRRVLGLAALPDERGRLVAVHRRHADVHEDHGEVLSENRAQGGAS